MLFEQSLAREKHVDENWDNIRVDEEDENRLPTEIIPPLSVFVPGPWLVIALVAFDEWELVVVEQVVDGIGPKVDQVVQADVDRKEYSRIRQVLLLPELKQMGPENCQPGGGRGRMGPLFLRHFYRLLTRPYF